MRGINPDHVQQIGRAHRPAELFFHHFVDLAEIRPVAQQLAETSKVREQHAVDEEARAVVNHNRGFTHLAGPGHHFGEGFIRGFLPADHFYQRHAVHRVKEVHTAEVFRTLEDAGQFADRDGGGVGGQHRIRAYLVFRLCQYRFFHFRVFDHRFDNHVHAIEPAVFQGWVNSRDHAGELQAVDLAAFELFIQQFGRFGHAQGQRLLANVFHHHWHAFPRRLVGDTAAHNACAQYRRLFWRLNIFGELLRFTLHELIVEENTDQRTGFVGVSQRDKTLVF